MSHSPLPLVELNNARVRRGERIVLDIDRWVLEPGTHWAILGGNGAGKSTFLALLRGDLWPLQEDGQSPRLYHFQGTTASPLGLKGRLGSASTEQQETYQQRGWRITVFEAVCSGFFDAPLLYQTPNREQEKRAEELMELLRISHMRKRKLPGLSQGELRRALIARALAPLINTPAVLLLDEVSDGLDADARDTLMAAVEDIMTSGAAQVLLTTHRSKELPKGLTHAAILKNGRVHEQGPIKDVVRPVSLESPPQVALPMRSAPPLSLPKSDEPLIHMEKVSISREGSILLQDINWTIRPGENWAVLGGNGAGKSTLLRCLAGELHPSCVEGPAGSVLRFGSERMPQGGLRHRIGFLSPEFQATYGYEVSAQELVWTGLDASIGMHGRSPSAEERAEALRWLEMAGIANLAERPITELSSGQARRCFLARAMAANHGSGPDLMLLDEPCSGLDHEAREIFLGLLSRVAQRGVPLIFVTHHRDDLIPEIDNVLLLEKGRVKTLGKRQDILRDAK